MFGGFFGDYLVKVGAITPRQLEEAIAVQRESNVLLGQLAVGRG